MTKYNSSDRLIRTEVIDSNLSILDKRITLKDLKNKIVSLEDKYKDFTNLIIELDSNSEGCSYVYLYGDRFETDEEYKYRLEQIDYYKNLEKDRKKSKEETELKEYLRLKKKFEKKSKK